VTPDFSIITPSYRQLDWLRLCAASITDQRDAEVEHIVQDAGGDTALEIWAARQPGLKLYVEQDSGMYDAINRGLAKAQGEICAVLNCDEQYLPDALAKVADAFRADPTIDVLLAGSHVVDGGGRYICSRAPLKPSLRHIGAGWMYHLTSSMFFRARFVHDKKLFFNPHLRIVGDMDWLRRAMQAGARIETLNLFTSTFADLGTNLALSAAAASEVEAIRTSGNVFRGLSNAVTIASHRIRRLLAGHYWLRPFSYSIFTLNNDEERHTFHVAKPTGVWRSRL
jgi:glycosyltransferase involved in cell wall biosynthesis